MSMSISIISMSMTLPQFITSVEVGLTQQLESL